MSRYLPFVGHWKPGILSGMTLQNWPYPNFGRFDSYCVKSSKTYLEWKKKEEKMNMKTVSGVKSMGNGKAMEQNQSKTKSMEQNQSIQNPWNILLKPLQTISIK